MCSENLSTLLIKAEESYRKVKYQEIVNRKFEGRNNHLHCLLSEMSSTNYAKISKLIKVLVQHGCSPNLLNDKKETPLMLIFRKSFDLELKTSLIKFICENADVNFSLCRHILPLLGMEESEIKKSWSFECMIQQLNDENDEEFLNKFEHFKINSAHLVNDLERFLKVAIEKNLVQTVKIILDCIKNQNYDRSNGKFQMNFVVLAAKHGRAKIFSMFFKSIDLDLKNKLTGKNLLHEILSSIEIDTVELHEMFSLVINDDRCTLEMINSEDKSFKSPLYYACFHQYNDIAMTLLKKGAYIGSKYVIELLNLNLVQSFLDKCLVRRKNHKDESEILIDYQFLLPPQKKNSGIPISKLEALKNISKDPKLKQVLKHPVMSSFLDLKWNVVKWLFYVKSALHFMSLAFLVFTLSYFLKKFTFYSSHRQMWIVAISITIFSALLFSAMFDFFATFRTYFFKLSNWLDILMIGTIIVTITKTFDNNYKRSVLDFHNDREKHIFYEFLADLQKGAAYLMIIVSGQCIKIVGSSIYVSIYRKVSSTVFRLFLMYSFVFVIFALSFQILFNANKRNEQFEELENISQKINQSCEKFTSASEALPHLRNEYNESFYILDTEWNKAGINTTETNKLYEISLTSLDKYIRKIKDLPKNLEDHHKTRFRNETCKIIKETLKNDGNFEELFISFLYEVSVEEFNDFTNSGKKKC